MEIESVKCECCGLKEECSEEYIMQVKGDFNGKWLCGLCSEAVRDELIVGRRKSNIKQFEMYDAVKAHMSFCGKYKSNPAIRVADGMRKMLRRSSGIHNMSKYSSSSNK
ncbi:uncharacterized protein LOC124916425 [Impatiens glandulifera]|uniref:uncharacterized protein LOC124916425 n=1 Tax=Impatiens glandulifera TaxID=253017 RepID=UPI001FB14979|nr:uncharacterized protein LOC124916425 [Impatiens glandulifera]